MFWIYVLVGGALGGAIAIIYSVFASGSGKADTCCTNREEDTAAPASSSCPLCSLNMVHFLVGVLIGTIAAVMITIVIGPGVFPFLPQEDSVVTAVATTVDPAVTESRAQRSTTDLAKAGQKPTNSVERKVAGMEPAKQDKKHYAIALTEKEFAAKTSKGIAIVDFWAEWCGPCKMQAPIYEALAKKYQGQVNFFKLNVDEYPRISRPFASQGIPALAVFLDGKLLARRVGYHDEVALEKLVKQVKGDPLPLLYPYVMRGE